MGLDFSAAALNVKHVFHDVSAMLYVEGQADEDYWRIVFHAFSDKRVKIESVGSSSKLDEYIRLIEDGTLVALAARDADFLRFRGLAPKCKSVMLTFGHSIENSIFSIATIAALVNQRVVFSRITDATSSCWVEEFETSIRVLVQLDIANELYNRGLQLSLDNCSRFMKSRTSPQLCEATTNDYCNKFTLSFRKREMQSVVKLLENSNPRIFSVARGHFIASAVLRFVQSTVKYINTRCSLDRDTLMDTALVLFAEEILKEHPERDYYQAAVLGAAATVA